MSSPTLRLIDSTVSVATSFTPSAGTRFIPVSLQVTATNPAGVSSLLVTVFFRDVSLVTQMASAQSSTTGGTTDLLHVDWAAKTTAGGASWAWATSDTPKNFWDGAVAAPGFTGVLDGDLVVSMVNGNAGKSVRVRALLYEV